MLKASPRIIQLSTTLNPNQNCFHSAHQSLKPEVHSQRKLLEKLVIMILTHSYNSVLIHIYNQTRTNRTMPAGKN